MYSLKNNYNDFDQNSSNSRTNYHSLVYVDKFTNDIYKVYLLINFSSKKKEEA